MVFEGLTSYSTPISCLHAVLIFDWLAGGWLLWLALAGLAGWLLAGWLADWLVPGWWLAGWLGLAGWLAWLAGCWLAGLAGRLLAGWLGGWLYILYDYGWLVFDGCGLPGFMGMNLTSFWPRFDLVLDLVPVLPLNLHLLYWLYQRKTMNIKCLPRIRGVPTSFYKLNMMFSTNQGTPQDYSSLHQIKAVAHMEMIGNGTGSLTLHPLPSSVRKKVSTDQRNSTVTRSGMLKSCKGSTLFDSYEAVTYAWKKHLFKVRHGIHGVKPKLRYIWYTGYIYIDVYVIYI